MAEENKEGWLNYLALSTVIFAVCATLATFKWGGFSTQSVMSQSQATDQWAYYQSKGIKTYLHQMQAEKMAIELLVLPKTTAPEVLQLYKSKLADYKQRVEKYALEKAEIEARAKQLEVIRDETQLHAYTFGIALIYLQIAILLSSVAGLLKRKLVWYGGLLTGSIGLFYFANGFLVVVK